MGQILPNMGIFVPNSGQELYGNSFLAGMVHVDQHDHSGGPNNGVPISSDGLADGSVTAVKLNDDVITVGGGLAFDGDHAIEFDDEIIDVISNATLVQIPLRDFRVVRNVVNSEPILLCRNIVTGGSGHSAHIVSDAHSDSVADTGFFSSGQWDTNNYWNFGMCSSASSVGTSFAISYGSGTPAPEGGLMAVLISITGDVTLGNANTNKLKLKNVTATSATAGANGAVPAQVAGYLTVTINGTDQKIPYYNT